MSDSNKRNLVFFESESMKGLYNVMDDWQEKNSKRLLSTNIQQDSGKFCCIALTNPSEVIICHGTDIDQASVDNSALVVEDYRYYS